MLILAILFTLCMFLYYQNLINKENRFIKTFANLYGPLIDSTNLNIFLVNDEDNLRWGLKLYLFQKGIIIGDPINDTFNLYIPFDKMQNLTVGYESITFYFSQQNSYLPKKFEFSCGNHSKFSNNLKLNLLKN